jgi:mono/diheme cytochrome c family protein
VNSTLLGFATGVASFLVLLVVAGLVAVYTGAYNVAATEDHASLTRWGLETSLRNSVERRAPETGAPDRVTPAVLAAGAGEYREMCEHCHAGPGVERDEWANGMRPKPPHLTEAATEWNPEEVFWIVKHGIKMTGMPAFGPTHEDQTLWNIAAFVKELPAMTPERYETFAASRGSHARSGHDDATERGHAH